ncbi:MAG: GNAT family N-acetyltransferase [Parvularculaceae bacterium]
MATVKRATSGDAAKVRAAFDALLPPDWREGPLIPVKRLETVLSDPRVILILAEVEQSPVGFVSGRLTASLCGRGDTAILDDLFVKADSRGGGIGKALVRAFRAEALKTTSRPMRMWSGTGVDNAACRHVFEAEGANAVDETYVEYVWDDAAD